MPLYALRTKCHRVVCPKLIFPYVARNIWNPPPHPPTVGQHSERRLTLQLHLSVLQQKLLDSLCEDRAILLVFLCFLCELFMFGHVVSVNVGVLSVLSSLSGCRVQSGRNNQGSQHILPWSHLCSISAYCSQAEIKKARGITEPRESDGKGCGC